MIPELMALQAGAQWFAIAFGVGYLIGSVPFGVLMARLFGLGDLRQVGSGNIGATNVLRTGNRKAALATLLLDGLKGAVAVLIFAGWGSMAAQFAALGAFIGHLLPVWLRFRGGKGVATYLGAWLALFWPVGGLNLWVWLAAAWLTRRSSAGALAASAACPFLLMAFGRWGEVLLAFLLAGLLWLRHIGNIVRLVRGTEPPIRLGLKTGFNLRGKSSRS